MGSTGEHAPAPTGKGDDTEYSYRGNRYGMPPAGPGSVPGFGRRFAALFFDWLLSLGAASFFAAPGSQDAANLALLIFAVQGVVLLSLFGTTIGKRLVGIGLAPTGERALFWPAAVLLRTVLLCLVIPAVVYDRDQRGLHDRAAGTIAVRI
ncbi:RDD family protein [Murinocardiopsis flavida]|uniref:RDD family protein n=1 Tax=Murinocardiopsis flavida TaxID=645275 RepID=A0A2P8CZZ0_9ACTN|nr:RDD family protein [Murinocardiopsis flavida]PSK90530.1 RDD family protein [Murinocardiopsis flavida]